jgi:copper(I)-binding protein
VSRPESRTARTRATRVAAVVGAMIAAVALAGCGAGQITQTSEQVAAVGGANATVGAIAVRNAQFEFDTAAEGAAVYPAGATAPLEMSIVNTGGQPDRLVAASSPVASAVEISGDAQVPGGRTLVVAGAPVAQQAAAPEPAAPATATPTPTPAAPAPTTEAAAPSEPGTASIVLTGLRQDLRSGPTYPVVLTFERAGDVRVDVPIGNPDTPREDAH